MKEEDIRLIIAKMNHYFLLHTLEHLHLSQEIKDLIKARGHDSPPVPYSDIQELKAWGDEMIRSGRWPSPRIDQAT